MTEGGTTVVQRLDRLYEFDREPVSRDRLCGGGYFAASFAGEHVAATEFVIGAMFVTWGTRVQDVVVGLAIGNLLAVLSWALICAPIAVETRLTLYWYLRKVGGPVFALIYNVLNALLFCVLAGCMITVAASAVRIPLGVPAPTHWYPTDIRFVLTVCVVGGVVVTLAIAGFKRLAAFATVCAPWMLLMFIVGALVMLPALGEATGIGNVRTFSDFWTMGERAVWIGQTPDGSPRLIGFWHVVAFAWICNIAMHIGLSDMAILRYARRSSYGFFSAFGMLLGHYLAWIAAGIMGAGAALALQQPLTELDSGGVAFEALGACGVLAVVIAGWTTSNPTLYRAGLALQVVTPDWPRWAVTLVVGVITTAIACFPFVFLGLLNFVAIYGLLLAPAGVIVLSDHWLLPRLGMTRCWASAQGKALNWPALIAWVGGMGLALWLHLSETLHLFYLFLPVCLFTAVVYVVLAGMAGAKQGDPSDSAADELEQASDGTDPVPGAHRDMGYWISGGIAVAALVVCLVMAMRVYLGGEYTEDLAWLKRWLIVPTLVYLVSATVWQARRMRSRRGSASD